MRDDSCGLYHRTALRMNRLVYLLILLLISAQFDDFWAVAPGLPSAPLADDDEYLPAQLRPQDEQSSSRREPMFACLRPQTADIFLVRTRVPSASNLTIPFTPPPIYVFMSLQI
jgi:hypothetical protein